MLTFLGGMVAGGIGVVLLEVCFVVGLFVLIALNG